MEDKRRDIENEDELMGQIVPESVESVVPYAAGAAAAELAYQFFPILIIDETAAWGTAGAATSTALAVIPEATGTAAGAGAAVAGGIGLGGASVLAAGAGVLIMTGDTIYRAVTDTLDRKKQEKLAKANTVDGAYMISGAITPVISESVGKSKSYLTKAAVNITRKGETDEYEVKPIGIASSRSKADFYQSLAAASGLQQVKSGPSNTPESIGSFMDNWLRGSSSNPYIKAAINMMAIFAPDLAGNLIMYASEYAIDTMFGTMREAGLFDGGDTLTAISSFVPHEDYREYQGSFGLFSSAMINGFSYNGYSYYPSSDESTMVQDALARAVAYGNVPTNLNVYTGNRIFTYSNGDLTCRCKVELNYYLDPVPAMRVNVFDDGATFSGVLEKATKKYTVTARYSYTRESVGAPWIFNEKVDESAKSSNASVIRIGFGTDRQCCSFGTIGETDNWVKPTPGVETPSKSGDTVAKVYPQWHNKAIQVATGIDTKGNIVYTPYIPLLPTVAQPMVETPSPPQVQTGIILSPEGIVSPLSPNTQTQKEIEESLKPGQLEIQTTVTLPSIPETTITNPGEGNLDPDIGSVPPIVVPEFTALDGDFYNMYKTQSLNQLRGFNGWLWSTDIVDNILRLFQKPLDSILALSVGYIPYSIIPSRGESGINVGNMTYSTSIQKITNQVVSISCGSVTIPYYYNSALDYEPYTRIGAYLPFVGEVEWSCSDCMNSEITIVYNIDLLTGSSMCIVTIKKPGGTSVPKYVYECNTMTNIPLSGNDFSRLYSSLATAALGVGAGLATGNPVQAASSALGFVTGSEIPVFKSGGLSSNAGALGPRTPFVIINRRNRAMPSDYNKYIGYPVNGSYTLGSLSGFTRVSSVHVDGIPGTSEELSAIETILKEGVIL